MEVITILTLPSNSSSRKSIAWLKERGIQYIEKRMDQVELSWNDYIRILRLSDNGFTDIISSRSEVCKKLGITIDDLTISQAYEVIRDNPKMLKAPIILSDKRLLIGFSDNINSMKPRAEKQRNFDEALEEIRLNQKDVPIEETTRGGMYETSYFTGSRTASKFNAIAV